MAVGALILLTADAKDSCSTSTAQRPVCKADPQNQWIRVQISAKVSVVLPHLGIAGGALGVLGVGRGAGG